ncbi:hypothetical protein HANVADRAFT_52788 [Hanseniaspora valbyensis NRRL Y-1626]|uniref:FUN14-domain-containing protein n=1 Tax=Hanseniaspora valbyensis NRRL Y-1626 TaxID=766949 RepID=A0A1B7TDE1_9ASCO|nr:hypothetical protein HANVADRAFT_52788 [Hanseniaspora valbyensis NRRL Y-1626]
MFNSLIKSKSLHSCVFRGLLAKRAFTSPSFKSQTFVKSKILTQKTNTTKYFGLFAGAGLGFVGLSQLRNQTPIKSEATMEENVEKLKEVASDTTDKLTSYAADGVDKATLANKTKTERHAVYRKITTGTLLGLVSGIIIGKVSQILVIVSSTIFIFLELLQSRGFIRRPKVETKQTGLFETKETGSKILNKLSKSINYVGENPALRLSFLITFLMSATA